MLTLRPMRVSSRGEAEFIYSVRTHPDVIPHLLGPPPESFESHWCWLQEHVDQRSRQLFLIADDDGPGFVGYCQATYSIDNDYWELGWCIHPDHQGKGYGKEAVWIWDQMISRIGNYRVLKVKLENRKAIEIYKKAGFQERSASEEFTWLDREGSSEHASLIYLGHAGFQLEYKNARLLCDPWFNPAFYNSWFPNPPNAHVKSMLQPPTHVYISHAHEDHFDVNFLRTLPEATVFIVPWFMAEKIQAILPKNKIVACQEKSRAVFADDFRLTMALDERKRDSAILIEVAGKKILNLNDCHLPVDQLPEADILFCQFSGAFHYPHCYDFSHADMIDKVHEVKERYIENLKRTVWAAKAKIYVPSAGPPRLSDPKLNRTDSIFYSWGSVAERIQECLGVELHPGDELMVGKSIARIQHPLWKIKDHISDRIAAELPGYIRRLNAKHREFLLENPKSFYLRTGGRDYTIRMDGNEGLVFNRTEVSDERANYTLKVPRYLMIDILKGGRWDAALLSNRIRLHRDRDVYDSDLFSILYRDSDDALPLEVEKDPEMVELNDGRMHQRYCPHQGEDLSRAEIINGQIICPRHRWHFDLETGKCTRGGEASIVVHQRSGP